MRRQKLKWRAAATRECPRTEHFAIRFRDNVIPPPAKAGDGGREDSDLRSRDILMARESQILSQQHRETACPPPPPPVSPSLPPRDNRYRYAIR